MENQGDKTTRKTSLKACSKNAETSPQHLLKAKSRIAYVKSSGLSCSVCASRLCHLPSWNSSWTAHLLRTIPGKQAQRSIVLDFVFKTLFSLVLLLMLVQPGSAEILAYRGGRDAVKSLCEAQCHSWCMDAVGRSCHNCSSSEIPEDVQWMIRCPEENQQQGFSDCQGSCSTFTGQNGYIPVQPEVAISRDPSTKTITLSWQRDPMASDKTVYVVSQFLSTPTPSGWIVLGWVHGNYFQSNSISDLCTTPLYRVAAVSGYGSRWFSPSVRTPALLPGPPRNPVLKQLEYLPTPQESDSIDFTLEWKPPYGWSSSDIEVVHNVTSDYKCNRVMDPVYVFIVSIILRPGNSSSDDTFVMKGKVPTYAIGCGIRFWINAISRCSSYLHGPAMDFIFNLTCDKFPNYKACHAPPVIIPGPVNDVKLTLVPYWGRFLGLVSWQPPDKFGSAGVVKSYHLFWGIINLRRHDLISGFKKILGHIILPATELNADLDINMTRLTTYETVGVLIRAAAPSQVIDSPFGDITLASNTVSPASITRSVLLRQKDVVIVQQDEEEEEGGQAEPVEVEVYWRQPPTDSELNVTAFGVQWGRLSRDNENGTSGSAQLLDGNFTVTSGG